YPQLLAFAQAKYGPTALHADACMDFVNFAIDIVNGHNKTARIWNDGLADSFVKPRRGAVVEWWRPEIPIVQPNLYPPQRLLDEGHPIVNCGWYPTYDAGWGKQKALASAYQRWEPHQFVLGGTLFPFEDDGPLFPVPPFLQEV
ncbi:hypothetical protein RKE29_30505, partial [Streptomyces sp. B1866]|nr:hypothetical protein [Streptomyces sp. B1866]